MGPEGRFTPESAAEFKAPETRNPGGVGVLEKPEEINSTTKLETTGHITYEESEIQVPINETRTRYAPNGEMIGPVEVFVDPDEIIKPASISSTARHEAAHVVVGVARNIGINGVDIKPKGNALGTTYPDRFDGPTAAAGHASGTGGEGHDFMLIRMHGKSPFAESASASEVLKKHTDEFLAIGAALDQHKYLSRNDINTIYSKTGTERIEKENKKTQIYEVPIRRKDGKENKYRLEVPKGTTMLRIPIDIYNANKDSFYSKSPKDF